MTSPFRPDDPSTWPCFKPLIIAHDVGRSRDRSTAVVGGISPFKSSVVGLRDAEELPQGLYGSARANALAVVDRRYHRDALIIADLSSDPSYGEVLYKTFGRRVIGVHIGRSGDGTNVELRPVGSHSMLVYTVGRSYLLELLHRELDARQVRFSNGPDIKRAYEQLVSLETEVRDTGVVYTCPPGLHDDLGISCAMLVFAARHPHLSSWVRTGFRHRMPRPNRPACGWGAFV
jgi:hypothetical protein